MPRQQSFVNLQNQIVFQTSAAFRVITAGQNRKLIRRRSLYLKIEVQSHGRSIKAWPEVS